MKVIKIIPLLIATMFWFSSALAQTVKADFTTNKTSGCPPSITVEFTNTSTGTGLTYTWDFGNGGSPITTTDKGKQYAEYVYSGLSTTIFTAKLTATDGTTTNSKTMTITVYKPPIADFKANPVKGCTPLTTTFTDLSTKGAGTINQWDWDYRNGIKSNLPNPSPTTYTIQGKYSIYLKVTDNNGCIGQIEKANYIDAADKPKVSFTPSPAKSCKVPQLVNFTNTSTGLGVLSYEWDFGNGDKKYTQNPYTTYTAYGIYSVKLVVNATDYNCNSTLEYPAVNITYLKANGTIKQDTTTIHSNDTICAGTLSFSSQSIGATNIYWNFGDGSTSYLTNPTHAYNTKGKYTVLLVASANGVYCSDSIRWIVNVEKVTANFNFNPTSGCTSPLLVNFINQSSDAKTYKWTFHDNSTSNQANPAYTYTIKPDKDPYVIHTEDSYPIILDAYSQHGCVSTATKYFKVSLPTALYSIDKSDGCAPLTVTFSDKSLPLGKINTRKWIFGDGTEQSLPTSIISHTYNTPGVYTSKLVATDILGCIDTSYIITIKVGGKPHPNFMVAPLSFYSDEFINVTDLTPAADNVNYWSYSINGKNIAANWDVKSPSFKFKGDTIGKLSVKLLAGSNGCFDSIVYKDILTSLGPIGKFSYDLNCLTPLKYTFKGIAKGTTSYEWDFGDGNKNSTTLTPEHTYTLAGNYLVKLITQNNSHYDTTSTILYVRIPNAVFTAKPSTCINEVVKFNSLASHSLFTTCRDKYIWNFGDNTPNLRTNNDSIDHAFTKRGLFNVILTALYENGCTHSKTQQIRAFSPYASIITDTTSGCNNLKVKFTDVSGSDGSTLTKWDWDFANGTDSSFIAGGHQFSKIFTLPAGQSSFEYPVVLSVTDNAGCIGTDTANIRISDPSASFSATSQTQLCSTDSAKLIRYFTEADSVIWYFGDGKISRSIKNPIAHKYANPGNYGLSLKIYKYHCTDSIAKPAGFIQVQKADARFTVSDSILNCQGEIKFKHTGVMSPVDSGIWHFGDRGNKGSYDTVQYYNYFLPGTYTTKLRVYTSFGCADTFTRDIKLFGPYADIAMNPRKACKGDTVTFELRDTANVFKWEWNFGEGIAFNNQNPVKYVFRSVGNKPITLKVHRQDTSCFFTSAKSYIIEEVIAKISIADTSVCAGENIIFNNQSTSVGQTIFNWDLGNGTTSTLNEPELAYTAGKYIVKLSLLNTINGCKDSARQAILINPIPIINVSNNTILCHGSSIIMQASGGNVVNWSPNKWLSGTTIYNPTTSADSTIKYYLVVSVDSTSCSAKDSVSIGVQQAINFTLTPNHDDSVFWRDETSMNITANETYNYKWSSYETDSISFIDPTNVKITPEDSITYFLTVKDINNCFTENRKIKFFIKDASAFGVANAFTPNGDEKNRLLKVQGKGIKELIDFKIYNRWGNVVFQSNDLNIGWDGTTQGKIQPIDTYIYTITVKTYKNITLSKKGSVLLIR